VVLLLVLASRSAGEEGGTTMNDGGEDLRSAAEAEEELKRRRRKRALLYWDAVVKDDRQLSRFELGDLERKMFSWSVKDIFRQQVTYRWSSQSSICLLVFL
jgi:hypothetical protein